MKRQRSNKLFIHPDCVIREKRRRDEIAMRQSDDDIEKAAAGKVEHVAW